MLEQPALRRRSVQSTADVLRRRNVDSSTFVTTIVIRVQRAFPSNRWNTFVRSSLHAAEELLCMPRLELEQLHVPQMCDLNDKCDHAGSELSGWHLR